MIRHLYLHIPFCHHICPYCAFYKHKPGKLANEDFVDGILSEARVYLEQDKLSIRPETIYFGGGTPSSLSPTLLKKLCEGLSGLFDLSDLKEWSIESNPSTFDEKKAQLMKSLGITRPSLGVQSFQPETLKTLGRDHSREEAISAYEALRKADFSTVSLDLMFSVPGQDLADWKKDLSIATSLNPDHISAYNLTYEEDTEFMKRHLSGDLDADEDRDASLFYEAIQTLNQNGYRHYEISNYAKPTHESLHNQAYWAGNDYLGLGPSAVSTVSGKRWKNLPDTAGYLSAVADRKSVQTEIEELSEEDLRIERIALLLRTSQGIPKQLVHLTGYTESVYPVKWLLEQNWMVDVDDHYQLTEKGKALADPIAEVLI